jgi:hypothetical protein
MQGICEVLLVLGFLCFVGEYNFEVWMWYTNQGVFMLCVVSMVIAIVIGVDLGTNDNIQNINTIIR